MFLRFALLIIFCTCARTAFAQVPFYTVLDTVEMKKIREQKLHIRYVIDQPYDSVRGKLKPHAKPDSTWTVFDRQGRQTEYSYLNSDGSRAYVRLYMNSEGQVVRRFSYDGDSTNGFLDYWTYNEKGQVTREVSCSREGTQEPPFSAELFNYDDSGKLKTKLLYYIDEDGNKRFDRSTHCYYSGGTDIRITLGKYNDTLYIDSVSGMHDDTPYRAHYYRYINNDVRTYLMLFRETETAVDTIDNRVREVYTGKSYDYSTGKIAEETQDTCIYDLKGNILETRDARHIQKYFYKTNGDLDYMMDYNRKMQPLFRRTEVYEYYE